jgi:hypothetical protein
LIVDPTRRISLFFPEATPVAILDTKGAIWRKLNGDCESKIDDFPFFRTRNQLNGDCGSKMDGFTFFSRTRYQIVDPKWMISHFSPGCEVNDDGGSKVDDFPFFSRTWFNIRLWIQN